MTDKSSPSTGQETESRAIPSGIPIRRVSIPTENDWNVIAARYSNDGGLGLGTTPGGTMYGTTPGGTRVMYDRVYLLQAKDKPCSHTPPTDIPMIPGVTYDIGEQVISDEDENGQRRASGDSNPSNQGQPLDTIREGKNDGSGDQQVLEGANGAHQDDSDSDYQEHEME